jgi:hypothetical protein
MGRLFCYGILSSVKGLCKLVDLYIQLVREFNKDFPSGWALVSGCPDTVFDDIPGFNMKIYYNLYMKFLNIKLRVSGRI